MALACLQSPAFGDRLRGVEIGQALPAYDCPGLDTDRVSSADAAGTTLVLVYLAAHQEQSRRALEDAHAVLATLDGSRIVLNYMSADADQRDVFRTWRDRSGAYEPFALDAGRVYGGRLGLIVYPTAVVTAPDGSLKHVIASWTPSDRQRLELYCRAALGELTDAEVAAQLAQQRPADDQARLRSASHRTTAAILRAQGQMDAAVQELQRAVSLDPDGTEAPLDLAEILLASGDVDSAERHLAAVLARSEDLPRGQLLMALVDVERGRLDEAQQRLTTLEDSAEDRVRLHYAFGRLDEQKGDSASAARRYRQAAEAALGRGRPPSGTAPR
ncbi:MAG: hypothetical protein C4547_04155 [Phycisphaerales bacterium]|nr:MAG: hypothetical protein C4547_04155 [Phycisphaerales bacterium]